MPSDCTVSNHQKNVFGMNSFQNLAEMRDPVKIKGMKIIDESGRKYNKLFDYSI